MKYVLLLYVLKVRWWVTRTSNWLLIYFRNYGNENFTNYI